MLQIDTAISTNMGGMRAGDKVRHDVFFVFFLRKNILNAHLLPKNSTNSPELTKSYTKVLNKHNQTGPRLCQFFTVFGYFKPDFNPALGQIWLRACKSQIAIYSF